MPSGIAGRTVPGVGCYQALERRCCAAGVGLSSCFEELLLCGVGDVKQRHGRRMLCQKELANVPGEAH